MEVVPYILSFKKDYIFEHFLMFLYVIDSSKSWNKFIGLYSSFEEIENC